MRRRPVWQPFGCLFAALCTGACGGDGAVDAGPVDAGHDAGPPDLGVPIPDLGRTCAYYDGGGADFGALVDLGPLEAPDLAVPSPDLGPPMPGFVNGCPSLEACLAPVGSDAGLTYDGFAEPLFVAYCTRCHSTTITGAARVAPVGYDWDDRTSVYAHLPEIRIAVGVANYMPYGRPSDLSCDLRRDMVTWIDTGAP